jgi:hypothetical protein
MAGKRLWLLAALTISLGSAGCTRNWCEHHGYAPASAYQPNTCCVPVCQCAPTAPAYPQPAVATNWQAPCTCPPPPGH